MAGKKLRGKEAKLAKALTTCDNNVARAGRQAGYANRQNAHRAVKSIQEKFPELMNRIGMTDEWLANHFLNGANGATKVNLVQGVEMGPPLPDEELRFKYRWAVAKMKGLDSRTDVGSNPSHAQHSGITLVVADERAAANIARLLSTGSSDHLVIDVDASVDEDLGRARHGNTAQAIP